MAERGSGAIVNVSTMVAQFGMDGMALYGSSKAALELLQRRGRQSSARGVRVNAVSPGPTRTEGTAGMGEGLDQLASLAPAGRPASPEEIARRSSTWPATRRISSSVQCSLSTAAGRPPEPTCCARGADDNSGGGSSSAKRLASSSRAFPDSHPTSSISRCYMHF